MNPALVSLAVQAGAPLVARALEGRIGRSGADLVGSVLKNIAGQAELAVEDITSQVVIDAQPEVLKQAIIMTEDAMPDLITLYQAELEAKMRLLEAEQKGPFWTWAWRPAGMWGLGFFWFYNIALLHWFNAYFKIALPPTDFVILIQISALYMSLYMGGHTVKDVMAKWLGGRANG